MGDPSYINEKKADIVPTISNTLKINEEHLFALTYEVLSEIFNILQLKVIPKERLREIILTHSTSQEIMDSIMKEPRSIPQYDEIEDTDTIIQLPPSIKSPVPTPKPESQKKSTPTTPSPTQSKPKPVDIPEPTVSPVSIPLEPSSQPKAPVYEPPQPKPPEYTPSHVDVPEYTPSHVEVPDYSPSPVSLPDTDSNSSPDNVPEYSQDISSEPEYNSDIEDDTDYITPSNVAVPSSDFIEGNTGELYAHDAIKTDIIPVIQNMIDVSSETLYSLSIDTLNKIFGYLETGIIPASEIETIILDSQDSNEISTRLQDKIAGTATTGIDNLKEDLITGILFNIPENIKPQIESKLRAIDDTDELVELSQLDLPELQSSLGLAVATSQPYNEKLDIIAGIIAQLPPSLQGTIGDRLQEIEDMNELNRLSQMNYVQIQQTLGLAAQSPSSIPAEFVNPVDTATQSPSTADTPSADGAAQPPETSEEPRISARDQEMLQKRREENEKFVQIIKRIAEKVWKVKIPEGGVIPVAASELKEKIEILYRIHPERLEKILEMLKRVKDRKRFQVLFEWYVYSHRIEEIETYVEHWQGQIQGIGGFRAAINVSRFDPIVEHLPTKEIEKINIMAKNALERVHNPNLNVRARGVEDIKQLSNYLLQKAR